MGSLKGSIQGSFKGSYKGSIGFRALGFSTWGFRGLGLKV